VSQEEDAFAFTTRTAGKGFEHSLVRLARLGKGSTIAWFTSFSAETSQAMVGPFFDVMRLRLDQLRDLHPHHFDYALELGAELICAGWIVATTLLASRLSGGHATAA
jgi:hypothetical protein